MAALTVLPNSPATPMPPTGPGGSTSLNPVFHAADPVNGNYFTATGRDLVTFYCSPAAASALWLPATTYTPGQVVSAFPVYNSGTTYAIGAIVSTAAGVAYISLQGSNINNTPGSAPSFWNAYVGVTGASQYIAITNASANLNQNPTTATAFWVAYTASSLTVYSAPDLCTGRKSDVVGYVVPDGGHTEFLVLPSSVFTQANGQVQFLATSTLIQVLVRSL